MVTVCTFLRWFSVAASDRMRNQATMTVCVCVLSCLPLACALLSVSFYARCDMSNAFFWARAFVCVATLSQLCANSVAVSVSRLATSHADEFLAIFFQCWRLLLFLGHLNFDGFTITHDGREYINREIGMQFGGWMCVVNCVGVKNATQPHAHTQNVAELRISVPMPLSWIQTNKCEIRMRMNEMYAKRSTYSAESCAATQSCTPIIVRSTLCNRYTPEFACIGSVTVIP